MGAQAISFDYSKYNFRDEVQPVYSTKPGLSDEVVARSRGLRTSRSG